MIYQLPEEQGISRIILRSNISFPFMLFQERERKRERNEMRNIERKTEREGEILRYKE